MIYNLLAGKKAIITGGRGLAEGIAEKFTLEGAEVVVFSRSDSAQKLVDAGKARHAIQMDLANRQSCREAFEAAMKLLDGRLDVLVNCAGIQRRHECEDFPMEDWDEVLEVNLTSVMEMCQMAGRVMLEQEHGKIINIASMNTFFGGIRIPAYAASKGGVAQLTKALSNAWASRGINVNAVAPGYMATEMNAALMADPRRSASILERIPAKRWGNMEDIAGPCAFLASDLSDYMNGAIIPVDGGYLGF